MNKLFHMPIILSFLFFLAPGYGFAESDDGANVTQTPPQQSPSEEPSYPAKTATKLGNGVISIVTSWIEIPKTMINKSKQDGLAAGLTGGFVEGVINMGGKIATGTADVATFPVPTKPMSEEFDMEKTFGKAFSAPSEPSKASTQPSENEVGNE